MVFRADKDSFLFLTDQCREGVPFLTGHSRGGILCELCTKGHQCQERPCHCFPFRAPEVLAASAALGHPVPDGAVTSRRKPCAPWLRVTSCWLGRRRRPGLQPQKGGSHWSQPAPVFSPFIPAPPKQPVLLMLPSLKTGLVTCLHTRPLSP